jgi:hypothetical protein
LSGISIGWTTSAGHHLCVHVITRAPYTNYKPVVSVFGEQNVTKKHLLAGNTLITLVQRRFIGESSTLLMYNNRTGIAAQQSTVRVGGNARWPTARIEVNAHRTCVC